MNLFQQLFRKVRFDKDKFKKSEVSVKENQYTEEINTDGKTYIRIDKGTYVFNRDEMAEYVYSDLSEEQYKHIEISLSVLSEAFASLLKFDYQPANHPQNLNEYLSVWSSSGFERFLGFDREQYVAFLAYNFGQYLVGRYNMNWQSKSDGQGSQVVVRMRHPIQIELYPIDSTLRAIERKERAIFETIEGKLKRALGEFV